MIDRNLCCGCNACGDVCPNSAITFKFDNEGFLSPNVDTEKCKDCNLCTKVCPMINIESLKKNNPDESVYFSAETKNMEVLFASSSGGIFSMLADHVYRQGGFVGGAVFNENLDVVNFISDSKIDLQRLRGAKYVQSNAEGFYAKLQESLGTGRIVLVCGTPCQISALRLFLGGEPKNLITVDFLCGGIASPLIWRKYLDSFTERYGSRAVMSRFDSKEYGWKKRTQKTILEDGRCIYEPEDVCSFHQAYRSGICVKKSCLECNLQSVYSDITLGNFYNSDDKVISEKNLGHSLIVLNTAKGKSLFENVKSKINFESLSGFPENFSGIENQMPNSKEARAKFFHAVRMFSFDEAVKRNIADKSLTAFTLKMCLQKIWKLLKALKWLASLTSLQPKALFNTIRYSGIKNLLHRKGIIFCANTAVSISRKAKLEIKGLLIIGEKIVSSSSKLESCVTINDGGELIILGNFSFRRGCNLLVQGGQLIIHGMKHERGSSANINCSIICWDKIEIGHDVQIGYDVKIRDNNGHHYINRQGYQTTRPVIIGDKAWLCSSCMIMPGVKIGEGAVVGANSFVISSVPAHSLVSGHPAKVIDRDIQWKY